MRLRDILIGAFATMIVTIIGGVVVYYITKEPLQAPTTEQLIYSWEKPLNFRSEERELSLAGLQLGNLGNEPATQVLTVLEFEDIVTIVDKSVSLTSGPAGAYECTLKSANKLVITFPSLTPGEIAKVSLLLQGKAIPEPKIGVKSSKTTGQPGLVVPSKEREETKKDEIRELVTILIPIALMFQILLLIVLKPRIRSFLRKSIPTNPSLNNTSFLYLHTGLTEQAEKLLQDGIAQKGADPHMLSNYGLALFLNGKNDLAEKNLKAAEFYAQEKHERAVMLFSRSILKLKNGDINGGLSDLRDAYHLSKSEIKRYCEFSVHMLELKEKVKELADFLSHEMKCENA